MGTHVVHLPNTVWEEKHAQHDPDVTSYICINYVRSPYIT